MSQSNADREATRKRLEGAMDDVQKRRAHLSEELASRAQAIHEKPRLGKQWEETKREILGHLP